MPFSPEQRLAEMLPGVCFWRVQDGLVIDHVQRCDVDSLETALDSGGRWPFTKRSQGYERGVHDGFDNFELTFKNRNSKENAVDHLRNIDPNDEGI